MRQSVILPVFVALSIFLVACGDDDGDAESAGVERYCQLAGELDEAGGEVFAELDFESATPEEIADAFSEFVDENAAALDEIVQSAPEEIRDAADTRVESISEVAETGDLSIEEEPDVTEADQELQEFEAENC